MSESYITDGMLEMFLYETEQMLEQLEAITLDKQKEKGFDEKSVNEIFRIMHTIKGSSGVMMYTNITTLTHKLEDVFYYLRESKPKNVPYTELTEYILDVSDFVKHELEKIKSGRDVDGDCTGLRTDIDNFLCRVKNNITKSGSELPPENHYVEPKNYYIAPVSSATSCFYHIVIKYKPETEMANIRAYTAVFNLKELAEDLLYIPEDIVSNPDSGAYILEHGFTIALQTQADTKEILALIDRSSGVDQIDIRSCTAEEFLNIGRAVVSVSQITGNPGEAQTPKEEPKEELTISLEGPIPGEEPKPPIKITEALAKTAHAEVSKASDKAVEGKAKEKHEVQSYISVNVNKMDELMDMIGELVISEAFVLQNQDLKVQNLDLTNFNKAAAQMSKITSDLQELIMSMRMMPLANTFQKMNRIVFDVSRKLGKDVDLKISGESTEMDKNIIEHISDPLMHLIRNALDHGIETKEERREAGKSERGTVYLEAKNEGGKVWIIVRDDGAGMNRTKLINKAKKQGLLNGRSEKDMTDKEILNLVTLPGFSTNEQVTEYSGRGVGMDVVVQNLNLVGGSLDIDSTEGMGTTFTMKIPLTLAIIDGIIISVGDSTFVMATGNIKEFISIKKEQLVVQPEGEEGVMIRGQCYPLIRLKEYYHLANGVDDIEQGILMIVEHEERTLALFVDKLVGEQEIVVKPLPAYIRKVRGISSCTQLGDGSISLIIDTAGIIKDNS